MKVELAKLKPNPSRDFKVDPIDPEAVEKLTESINQSGFWGGVVCRQVNGEIQIIAGQHRIEAAKNAGIHEADLYVGDFDEADLTLVYARENATQRGNSGTAIAGSVASAIRFLVKAIMTGAASSEIWEDETELTKLRTGIISGKVGLGEPIITRFLKDVPGINKASVTAQLANLKASGDYQRIVCEISQDIENEQREHLAEVEHLEREAKEAQAEAERTRKAREAAIAAEKKATERAAKKQARAEKERAKAEAKLAATRQAELEVELKKFDSLRTAQKAKQSVAGQETTFDFEGVAKHLKNENQIRVFREVVSSKGVKPVLAVSQQAALAAELVRSAKATNSELTGKFIRDSVVGLLITHKAFQRKINTAEQTALEAEDVRLRFERLQHHFARNIQGAYSDGVEMLDLMKRYRTTTFVISQEFRRAVKLTREIIGKLIKL